MNDLETLALIAIAAWALDKLSKTPEALAAANRGLQQGGAKVYDYLHPAEQDHKEDLPGHQWTRERLLQLMMETGFPDPNMATAIALAESGGVPGAKGDMRNGEFWSYGLFQINIKAHPIYGAKEMLDPVKNAAAAYHISKGGKNWKPWSVFKSGRYKNYL